MNGPEGPRRPLRELAAFLASSLAGLGVLRRRPAPLPEVPTVNGSGSNEPLKPGGAAPDPKKAS